MGFSWDTKRLRWSIIGLMVLLMSCNQKTIIKAAIVPVNESDELDPSSLVGSNKYIILDNLLGKLVNLNSVGDYEFMLAEEIIGSDDYQTYFVTIKPDAKFSDGSRITSQDVANSLNRLAKKGSLHIPFKTFLNQESKPEETREFIEVINDRKIKITFDYPCKEFIYYMSLADAGILPKKLIEKDEIKAADHSVTSGAYRLKKNILIKNENFILYNTRAPDEVHLLTPKDAKHIEYINYDIGTSVSFNKNKSEFWKLKDNYKYATSNYQGHAFILLNTDNEKFKDPKVRRSINKKIQQTYKTGNNPFFLKSHQFFIPNSFAFQNKFSTLDLLSDSPDEDVTIPSFKIYSQVIAQNFVDKNIADQISNALGRGIEISFTDKGEEYGNRKKNRDFDAYLIVTSMSYRVLTESLNLLYLSPNSFAKNPNGKIKNLIKEFHANNDINPEKIIEQISKEIALESEVIPLNYASTPIFYDSNKLDISELNTTESLTFWKLNVK